jgi:hypothetical protein
MVATSGSNWRLAPSLIAMWEEANRLAPRRSRAADGSIGDAAHSARLSDHNPADGWVCAVDLTHDPVDGWDAHARARMLVARHDHRIKYVISNGQIARSYNTSSVAAWTWGPYTGANAHLSHAHFSVHNTTTARNDVSAWWPSTPNPDPITELEDILMADPRGAARLCMRTFLGRSPKSYTELDYHAGVISARTLNGYIEWLEQQAEAKAWATKIGAEVRTPDST